MDNDKNLSPILDDEPNKINWKAIFFSSVALIYVAFVLVLSNVKSVYYFWSVPIITTIYFWAKIPFKKIRISDYLILSVLSLIFPITAGFISAINTYEYPFIAPKVNHFSTDIDTIKFVSRNIFDNETVKDYVVNGMPIVIAVLLFVLLIITLANSSKTRNILKGLVVNKGFFSITSDFEKSEEYINPLDETDLTQTEENKPLDEYETPNNEEVARRISVAAKLCYDQFELIDGDTVTIFFDNSEDYVDSYLDVECENDIVTNINFGFAIPPNPENSEWNAYAISINSPEMIPEIISVIEICQDGSTNDLDSEYYEWIADCIDDISIQETVDQKPEQKAPSIMY